MVSSLYLQMRSQAAFVLGDVMIVFKKISAKRPLAGH